MGRTKKPKQASQKITQEVEIRIVALSLENPDFGAKRLIPLLKQENITVSPSSVYRILKRHGLHTRDMRLSKIETQRLENLLSQEDETPPVQDEPVPLPTKKVEPVVEKIERPAPAPQEFSAPPPIEKSTRWSHPLFLGANVLLLILIGYLGFYSVKNYRRAERESDAAIQTQSTSISKSDPSNENPRPLSDYQRIWHRNLFDSQTGGDKLDETATLLQDVAVAKTDIGLKLLGTVVTQDNPLSLAVIKNLKTNEQVMYREEDKVGEVYIKKILRNKVVISVDNEFQLLTVEPEDYGRPQRTSYRGLADERDFDSDSPFALVPPDTAPKRTKRIAIRVNRDDVENSLADVEGILNQVRITPYRRGGQPSGFRISRIPRGSVLRKLGLRSRDIIQEVNGKEITHPDQATDFFNTLSASNELEIKLKRRSRNRLIKINIE